jgi:hypothetical protein
MIPAINSAASGIRQGLDMLGRAARNIADRATEGPDSPTQAPREVGGGLVDDLVATIIARHMVSLNAGVLRRADSAVGSLIDIVR